MVKRIFISLFIFFALLYAGLGIYFYKKSFQRKFIPEIPVVETVYNSSDLVALKESFYDFDDGKWKNAHELTSKKSSSGKNSILISAQTEFAGEIIQSFSEIPSLNNLREVEITLKTWHEKIIGEGVVWVLEVSGEDGKSLDWFPCDLSAPKENWETQTFRFRIKPDHLKNFNRIKTYAWNQTKSTCYIDDIRIRYFGIPPENKMNEYTSLNKSSYLYTLETDSSLEKTGSLTDEISHSGKRSSLMDGKNEYSVLIGNRIKDVMNDSITSLSASVWLYPMKDDPECTLVFEAKDDNDQQIFLYEKNTSGMKMKSGAWQKLNASFNLASEDYRKLKAEDLIYIYVKNNCRAKIYADDFEISYGNVPDRRGMQTFVDMNSINLGSYQFNRFHPPFPVSQLLLKNIHNDNSKFLVKRDSVYIGSIKPDQFISAGNFTGNSGGHDELLVVSEKEIDFYYYCENKSAFIFSGAAPFEKHSFNGASFITGDFDGNGKHELIINSGRNASMYRFETSSRKKCVNNDEGVRMSLIWEGLLSDDSTKMFAGHFSPEKPTELFLADSKGNCSIKKFSGNEWKEIGNGTFSKNVFGKHSTQVVGKFLGSTHDGLLAVYLEKNQTISSLIKLDGNNIKSKNIPEAELSNDLFKWNDVLFSLPANGKNADDILAYNHQWRFELNRIASDNHGFYVASVPEFSGFNSDSNPKYYEIQKLVTGKFTGNESEIICILYNCADSDFKDLPCKKYDSIPDLPNSIQLYTFSK